MAEATARPDVQRVLSTLKDFQLQTVDHVFRRLYTDPDRTHRYLVADEVGLGKTLVARGVIARAIDHLWESVGRIDVVYICSSGDIARQNISRLNITDSEGFALASRVTLLPTQLKNIQSRKLNFISFTPGTSFQLASNAGRADERVLLYWLLETAWGFRGMGPRNVLQGGVRPERFREMVDQFAGKNIDSLLKERFNDAIKDRAARDAEKGIPALRERFEELCDRFGRTRLHVPREDRRDQNRLIGDLRSLLASTCIRALEPDLVILDEFQRFKDLLRVDETDEDGESDRSDETELAQELFNYSDGADKTRILLLSATPYKMYTMVDEMDTDDHYADFLQTLRFLNDDASRSAAVEGSLQRYRRAMQRLAGTDTTALNAIRSELEFELRRVMVRTERLAASPDRSGMLREIPALDVELTAEDALTYCSLQQLADDIEHHDVIEYWKAAPYLLSFMDDYVFKRHIVDAVKRGDRDVEGSISGSKNLFLPPGILHGKEGVNVGHSRLAWLLRDTVDRGWWRLLWMPAAMPYYAPEGVYADDGLKSLTKRLVFSSWQVVPKAAAALLSYEAERQMVSGFDDRGESLSAIRDRLVPLLRFARDDTRLTGMPILALIYPSIVLADLGDPRGVASPSSSGGLPTRDEILAAVEARLAERVDRIVEKYATNSTLPDESWYWAAPLLLDAEESGYLTAAWLDRNGIAARWSGEESTEAREGNADLGPWADHIARARDLLRNRVPLGSPPPDLARVMAQLAVAGPANVALRALARVTTGHDGHSSEEARDSAGQIAWGFRNLFNLPEVIALVRSRGDAEPYWRRVLEYMADGNLQAVLDEYLHVLTESLGLFAKAPSEVLSKLTAEVRVAMGLRTAAIGVDELVAEPDGTSSWQKQRMRSRFAARFGDGVEDGGAVVTRKDAVRSAFNSPFWPFVLTTTSVGQEGLDFHQYCHAVVHWNLPANPVDLEQREGRVHRFKGHAVRKNVSARYAERARSSGRDPWYAAFEMARADRAPGVTDIVPYWVFQVEGGATIERHVPALPLSRDEDRLKTLRKALVVYRIVFGQPRQDELLDYLQTQLPPEEVTARLGEMRIDLSPR